MMLALGTDVFRAILEDFWSKTPPQLFASAEAEAFAEYLRSIDLKVPQLAKILEFECAVLATLVDEQPRVTAFEFDPLPFGTEAARMYGRVAAAVVAVGRKPRRRVADLMIAATAMAENLPLFTTNPGDFAGLGESQDEWDGCICGGPESHRQLPREYEGHKLTPAANSGFPSNANTTAYGVRRCNVISGQNKCNVGRTSRTCQ